MRLVQHAKSDNSEKREAKKAEPGQLFFPKDSC